MAEYTLRLRRYSPETGQAPYWEEFGVELDPENTHVFMCGNPAMIGLPKEDEETGELTYPEPTGVVEILTKRGFTLDHRKTKGNLHYEEYW